jgi:septal ring factor EnvC (AmiA/AmiB activator)
MPLNDIFQTNKLKDELEQVKNERDRLKAAINKFRNEFEQVKNEYRRLKTAMSEVERMEAYGLKKAIEALLARKKQITEEIAAEEENAAKQRQILNEQVSELNRQIAVKRSEIIVLDEEMLLQSFGFYQPRYDLANSLLYKSRLDHIRSQQAKMVKDGTAAHSTTTWLVNNSEKEGTRMIKDYVKLILRSFNNECDASIVNVKFNNVNSIAKKIQKAFDTLNKLGERMNISITQAYLELKLEELYLCHEYQVKKQQEKEEQKRIREQMREEAKLLKEIEDAKLKLEKEEKHFNKALSLIQDQLGKATTDAERTILEAEKDKIEQKLIEVTNNMLTVEKREQNTRAGYVYIISNIGSFGENVYKIGVTRRLEPQERVDELGDASVPFD